MKKKKEKRKESKEKEIKEYLDNKKVYYEILLVDFERN